jgi:hypothetical protein
MIFVKKIAGALQYHLRRRRTLLNKDDNILETKKLKTPTSIPPQFHFFLNELENSSRCNRDPVKNPPIPFLPEIPGGVDQQCGHLTLIFV